MLKGKRYSDFLDSLISYTLFDVPNPYRGKEKAAENKTAPDTTAEPSDELIKMLDELM